MDELVRVRCAGTPVETHARETPTEIDMLPSCGWEGPFTDADWIPAEAREWVAKTWQPGRPWPALPRTVALLCPQCRGVVKPIADTDRPQGGDAHDHALDLPGQQRGSRTGSSAGADVTGPATTPTVAGPTLQQAIQAATDALADGLPEEFIDNGPYATACARIAVAAAAPILTADLHAQVEVLRVALAAARGWMVEHGLQLTDGHARIQRGVSFVDMDAAFDQTREQADG